VLLALILIGGIVGYARLVLKQHTLNQLLVGAVLGFVVSYLVFEFGVG
jgi:membrane-associated phospholipid phosphatase